MTRPATRRRSTRSATARIATSASWKGRDTCRLTAAIVRQLRAPSCLLRAQLAERAEPVLHVECSRDSAVAYRLDVDCHHPEALAGVGNAEQFACRRAGDLAAHDDAVAGNEHLLDVELHVGDGVREVRHDLDRGLSAPALAGR